MNKFVIDTNVLIASVPAHSPYQWIWEKVTSQEFIVCVTTEILHEYEEVLSRYFGEPFADYIMGILDELPNLEYVTRYFAWNLFTLTPMTTNSLIAPSAPTQNVSSRKTNISGF